ncbi:MAG TPA: HmuY family protein [Bacteroidia bacterium]|nr:HmuY family protein [Bacteroidia bacterium]
MRTQLLTILVVLTLSLSSCWKDEDPIVLPSGGNTIQESVSLGQNYDKMAYFNIDERRFIIRNLADWDLAFESSEEGLHIVVNGGKGYTVLETPTTNFASGFEFLQGMPFKWDAPSGNLDSTAVGKWWDDVSKESRNKLYFINTKPMEVPTTGTANSTDCMRFQILEANKTSYRIKIGKYDDTVGTVYTIPKDHKRNFSYLNFTTGEIKTDFEPEKDTWDVVFTYYRHVYFDMTPNIGYTLVGVLLNPNKVEAYEERSKKFEDIDLAYAQNVKFTKNAEVIGFDWKDYNQVTGRYTTNPKITYIVKTISGYYYKIRFLDFYDTTGVKGTPLFDMQRL